MRIQLNGVGLLALHNALNEVAAGLWDRDLPVGLQARREEALSLRQRTGKLKLNEPLDEARYDIDLTANEAGLGAASLDAAMNALGASDFHARLGVTHEEAAETAQRLRVLEEINAEP